MDPTQIYNATLAGYGAASGKYDKTTKEIGGQYQDLYDQQAQYGASQKLALEQSRERNLAQQQQSMLARGLGNTTVLDSGARGINYDYNNSLLTLNDQLYQRQNQIKQAQLGYLGQAQGGFAGLQQNLLGFMGGYGQAQAGYQSQQEIAQQQAAAQSAYGLQAQAQGAQQQQQYAQMQASLQHLAQAQQGQQQQQLSQQNYQQQAALQQQQYDQSNYQNENFGYY